MLPRNIFKLPKWIWEHASHPAKYLSLGSLTVGGFLMGIFFWGGFNTALEVTNTEAFCISCHEMRDNVYRELQRTVHYTNRSGVRATCPDCHVPYNWTDKITRKVQASKEVWGWIFGVINTPEKFNAHRREMAEREWARLKANDSLECRNCHKFESMDLAEQSPRAAQFHEQGMLDEGKTCIDCHKGIAHTLPDMTGVQGYSSLHPPIDGRLDFQRLTESSVHSRQSGKVSWLNE